MLPSCPHCASVGRSMRSTLFPYTTLFRSKKSLLKCNWTIRKRLPRCKMRLKKRLLAFSRRLHASNRSEERFSRNAETDLVCRLLLEKKNKHLTLPSRQVRQPPQAVASTER